MVSGCYGQQEPLPQNRVSLKALPLRVLGQPCPAVMTQHWTHQCSAWHCRRVRQCGLSRPSLSLYGRCTVTTVDSGTPPRAGRTHATFPRGTQLCQAQHGRLLVSPGWASSEEHGDGEPARGQRGPKLRSIVIRAAYWGVLEGLRGKAGSRSLLQPSLLAGTMLLHSIFSPNPLPFHPCSLLSPCPLLPTHHLFSSVVPKGPLGRAERLEQGTGLWDTAMM